MRIFTSILVVFFALNLNAQNNLKETALPKETGDFATFFNFNEGQAADTYKFLERKANQIEEISNLKDSDLELYITKRDAINNGFKTSLGSILIESQKEAYKTYLSMIRKQNAEIRKKLKAAGKSEQEIMLAIVEN